METNISRGAEHRTGADVRYNTKTTQVENKVSKPDLMS